MRNPRLLAALAVSLLSMCAVGSYLSAQTTAAPARPAAPPARGGVALLDVTYLFDNHPRFKGMMNDMKVDIDRAETEVKAEREALKKRIERLERFKGTKDYKQEEEDIAKAQSDLGVRINIQKKDFVQREAMIYLTVYQEISREVDDYCTQNAIEVVLRFNGDPVDKDRPDSVLAHISRPVVWQARGRDITGYIQSIINQRYPQPRAAGPAQGPARREAGVPFQR